MVCTMTVCAAYTFPGMKARLPLFDCTGCLLKVAVLTIFSSTWLDRKQKNSCKEDNI